eukprot:TRINITY_DN30056_c0_g1_i1.p1 TRINITY_DN30056_c0_g1~~TRINITY_DN30056_c0_g1_i1.p1  ORF type:complete len:182 (-),score=33.23 TRINITY_DN30056_c0_g1_i1:260-805(-)
MLRSLVGSEMCIRDRVSTQSTGFCSGRMQWLLVLLTCVAHSQHIWDLDDTAPTQHSNPWDPNPLVPRAPAVRPERSLKQQREARLFEKRVRQEEAVEMAQEGRHPPAALTPVEAERAVGKDETSDAASGQVPLWLLKMRMSGKAPEIREARATPRSADPWDPQTGQFERVQDRFVDAVAPT